MPFQSVHNVHEAAIFRLVVEHAAKHAQFADDKELLADVACVALNRLSPRYIRHDVDYAYYTDDGERLRQQDEMQQAVEYAFEFLQNRVDSGPR